MPPLDDAPPARPPLMMNALKRGDTFAVFDAAGDILGDGDGLFDDDTRLLSRYRLFFGDTPPALLSSRISEDNVFFTAHLTNRPLPPLGGRSLPEGVIHLERRRFLHDRHLFERFTLTNYTSRTALVPLVFRFAADFRDMFEVRGIERTRRGEILPPEQRAEEVVFAYRGLDGVLRQTVIAFSEAPAALSAEEARFTLELPPNGTASLFAVIGAGRLEARLDAALYRRAAARARAQTWRERRRGARLSAPAHAAFDDWLSQSAADLALLITELPTGPYPYAGIPWFSTTFGRDAIITALQTLWLDPKLARGVLGFLARTQSQETSSFRDAEPGKIIHEARKGEMPALGEVPFGRYYGGVDTTPLFLVLAARYAERSGDFGFIDHLWPHLLAAMGWIEQTAARHPDGFLAYARGEETGLANQGWKDSQDSVFHADGRLAEGPIALVEVQGYVYAALLGLARLARRRGEAEQAEAWERRAAALREAVEAKFWIPELGFYGIALDGAGELCRVRASNAGQLLFSGLPAPERAARVARELLSPRFDTGFGIRTLAAGEARYNPMSYHNGSVWPHDTALIVAGLARYGFKVAVRHFLERMFDAARHFGMRLPELFCGFPRTLGEGPVPYPVACLPQAWAAGAVFMMVQAALGFTVEGERGVLRLSRPILPQGVERLQIRGLAVGEESVDLTFLQTAGRIACLPTAHSGAPVSLEWAD
jgi:glycogen debranching enzyme